MAAAYRLKYALYHRAAFAYHMSSQHRLISFVLGLVQRQPQWLQISTVTCIVVPSTRVEPLSMHVIQHMM